MARTDPREIGHLEGTQMARLEWEGLDDCILETLLCKIKVVNSATYTQWQCMQVYFVYNYSEIEHVAFGSKLLVIL